VGCRPAGHTWQNNFDIVRYEYYRDREVAFEGFTARSYLFREEFTSRTWATRYDFPALRDGRIKRDVISDDTPSGAQGWFFNTRREKLKDKRLREAVLCAFDFEWTNKMIMYGSYQRTHSVFQNSDMMAVGKSSAEELALSNHFAARCPMRCSENRSCRRFPMDRVRIVACCARPARSCSKPASSSRTASG
jgi:microcin C transport system substrate-binding protein